VAEQQEHRARAIVEHGCELDGFEGYGGAGTSPSCDSTSVLSAIEGLEVTSPRLADLVLPLAVLILAALFAVQRRGTHRVGRIFGPVMVLWFISIGLAGLAEVIRQPGILRGLSPTYAASGFPCLDQQPPLADEPVRGSEQDVEQLPPAGLRRAPDVTRACHKRGATFIRLRAHPVVVIVDVDSGAARRSGGPSSTCW
jgi:hypothetical protein